MKNSGSTGFGGPEYQPPPPYSPSYGESNNPPYIPFYTPVPVSATPSLGTAANAANNRGVTVPITSAGRELTVTIPRNAQTVTVLSYDPPPRQCKCMHGFMLALLFIAAIWVLAKFLEDSKRQHGHNR